MKKLSVFTVLLLIFSARVFSESYRLSLKTFYTSDSSLTADALPDDIFKPNSYVNSYNGKTYCWIESVIPAEALFPDKNTVRNYIMFNSEPIHTAEIYFLGAENEWIFAGKTGAGLNRAERTKPFCTNSIGIHEETLKKLQTDSIKVRMRIRSYRSTLVQPYLVTSEDLAAKNSFLISFFAFVIGACLITIIYLNFICFVFNEYDSFTVPVLNTVLLLKIMAGAGIFNPLLITRSAQFYNGIYFVLFLAVICAYQTLRSTNRPVLNKFPETFLHQESYSPICVIITATIGILYVVIPVPSQLGTAILCIPFILTLLFTERCVTSTRYNPVIRKDLLIMWLASLYLITVEQIFLSLRFLPDTTSLCRLFDNNIEIPTIIAFTFISAATVRKLHAKVRMRLATIQLNSETIRQQIRNEEKKNILMSSLISDLLNPIQNLHSVVEKYSGELPPELLSRLKRSLSQTTQSVSVINTLTARPLEKNPLPLEKEPVFLRDFTEETILPEITNLKLRDCFTDVKYDINPDTAVSADKPLLALFLKFMLRTAVSNAKSKSTVMISTAYENITFSCKVHFFSEPLSTEDIRSLLSIGSGSDETESNDKKQFERLIKTWGVQLFILKHIVDALRGNISISPSADGNSIAASIVLEPAVPSADAYSDLLDNARNAQPSQNPQPNKTAPQFPEVIYIMEEDDDVREEIKRLLSRWYKTVAFANGNDFILQKETGLPDVILCSTTLPGKNAFDILHEIREKLSAPFIVLAKSLSRNTIDKLYEAGASDIIVKPFSEKTLLDKINAILHIRRNYTIELFYKIETNVKNLIAGKNSSLEIPHSSEKANPAVKSREKTEKSASFTAVCVSARLTKKEIEIASLMAKGLSDKKIAETAAISPATVAVHNKNIFKKLNIHSRAELIKLAEQ